MSKLTYTRYDNQQREIVMIRNNVFILDMASEAANPYSSAK